MPALRPLARSLPPLPDESLPGFLLRLAFRLDTSPAELAVRTGLADRAHLAVLPAPLLIRLPDTQRHTFARMIKATDAEMDAMLLDTYSSRYPPAQSFPNGRNGMVTHQHRWLFLHATRYCPQCLAGRGNPMEKAFGGAWKNSWRLPPVFACLEHRRFLEHLCPACNSLVLHTATRNTARHMPRWRVNTLHPTQCREFIGGKCGHRLDGDTATAQQLPSEYRKFQRFLLELLNPSGPGAVDVLGHPTSPAHYFTDLRTTCHILRTSWPNSRHLLRGRQLISLLAQGTDDSETLTRSTFVRAVSDMPYLAAQPHAALLLAADRLLRTDTPDTLAGHLRTLINEPELRPSKVSWARAFLDTRPECSEGFLQAVSSVVHTYARPNLARNLKQPVRKTRFRPEHIPQFLEDDWYQKYFAHMEGIATVHLRRTVALRLCQAASGGSIQKAADRLSVFLSNPAVTARIADSPKRVHRWARNRPDPLELETAIRDLAAELDARNNLIDYEQRRRVLSSWCIGPRPWKEIASRIAVPAGGYAPGGGFAIDLSDRKRNIASVILWTLITQGEHIFAPTPICDQQDPETQRKWRMSVDAVWARMQHRTTRPTDTQMITALEEYAAYLLPIVDRGDTPLLDASPWT
ncbi:TniQ family protein [Streptomyces sp. H10-C2]|uniref:TniQ family protein n=1 Tax=unclassified Streptomyces TaxID=2593676 RepID=UPI0024B9F61F|nr:MULTISPECIES: TniQ family protein [unclassified Streptomyces]MDJ0345795.1 TniQ family protein [Streptomyces sp. PH10-H1]MDJ0374685.1 TniQ family protein [Streptomyces sp. H10-C2]